MLEGRHFSEIDSLREREREREREMQLKRNSSSSSSSSSLSTSLFFTATSVSLLVFAFHLCIFQTSEEDVVWVVANRSYEEAELSGNGLLRGDQSIFKKSKKLADDTPPLNSTVEDRLSWLKQNWKSFRIFRRDRLSASFAARVDAFLMGQVETRAGTRTRMRMKARTERRFPADAPCGITVFMTWIASVDSFGPRERLALESIFRTHKTACVLILSRSLDSAEGRRLLRPFALYGFRLLAVAPDLPLLFNNTPASKWLDDLEHGKVDPGIIPLRQNLSNILRLAALYRYGGIYMDSDMIVLNPLSNLSNALGAQSVDKETGEWRRLNNAFMAFEPNHPLMFKFIQEFSLTFDGNKWGHNGPYLVSRVVRRVSTRPGHGCTILAPLAFYPVDWEHIRSYFCAPKNRVDRKWQAAKIDQLKKKAFTVHLWNKQSREMEVELGSIMETIFKQSCVFCGSDVRGTSLQVRSVR